MATFFTRCATVCAGLGAAATLALAGCTPNQEPSDQAADPSPASSATGAAGASVDKEQAQAQVTFEDAVVRAKGEDNHMTAVFGKLVNHSDREVQITGFESSLNAPVNQLHETRDGVMQEMSSPLAIPAGGTRELAAGGDHLMIMDYQDPVAAGDTVDITFKLADGSTIDAPGIPVRTMLAGEEDYGDLAGVEGTKHEGMNHGAMNHEGMNHGEAAH